MTKVHSRGMVPSSARKSSPHLLLLYGAAVLLSLIAIWWCVLLSLYGGLEENNKGGGEMMDHITPTRNAITTYGRQVVILIVPFRDKESHERFMKHLSGLRAEKPTLHVLVIRETNSGVPYTRNAWLLNVGLHHAASSYLDNSTCFITQDIDLLPDLESVDYSATSCNVPAQLCSEQSCFGDRLPYVEYAGGVVSAKREDWLKVNGYTSSSYDWDGEGDDLYWRFRRNQLLSLLQSKGSTRSRWMLNQPAVGKGRCECAPKQTARRRSYVDLKKVADRVIRMSLRKSNEWKYDGLNSLSYKIDGKEVVSRGGFTTSTLHVSEPDPELDSGLRSHKSDKDLDVRQPIVLVFAYRDRLAHYHNMMRQIQRLRRNVYKSWDLHVYVVEQMNTDLFRKGWLLNVGFHEVAKRFDPEHTCVVQHDIDLIPNLDTINYEWCEIPTQLCTEISCFGSTFPYVGSCAGGVMTARLDHWQKVNGYTLKAYGWGAEDDDIYFRLRNNGLVVRSQKHSKNFPPIRRPEDGFGQCDCVDDGTDADHTQRVKSPHIYNLMMKQLGRMRRNSTEWMLDGYNNTEYELLNTFEDEYGSTWFQVNYTAVQWSPKPQSLDPVGPQPVILMSLGRSGSTGIFHAIGNLTGKVIFADEYVGEGPTKTLEFFNENSHDEEGQWLVDHMYELQKKHTDAGIVGFKWKPYAISIEKDASIAAIKRTSMTDPPIKVIHSYRNPLDVMISENKHVKSNYTLGWFCKAADKKCIESHRQHRVELPTKGLVRKLRTHEKHREKLESLLVDLNVPHITTTYEKLYYSPDAEAWMEMFRFIGVGPTSHLGRDEIDSIFEFAKTSSLRHADMLSNYKQVKQELSNTEFEHLLH